MSETAKYIFIRINDQKNGDLVHSCESLKDANYWLNYIAEPGDAMFITSSHPNHTGSAAPEYHSHLVSRRNISRAQSDWLTMIKLESDKLSQAISSL